MRQLEKITISNVRRFSENVEISIGRGATVFLAPNGTGKTAIFEAIELALTGKVKRLPFPPDALIRDSKTQSNIRLDFDAGKFCNAIFKKGADPLLTGDHDEIFSGLPINDVAFLLRLTHLLSQRGNDWLVQSQSDAAADQLDHLAIGRDALHANELIPSAKRQGNSVLDSANRHLEEIKKSLDLWENLQNSRVTAKTQIAESTKPLSELLSVLNDFGHSRNISALSTTSLEAVIAHQKVIQKLVERGRESNQQKLLSINASEQLVIEYNDARHLLEQATKDLTKTKESKKEIAKEINEFHDQFVKNTSRLQSLEETLTRFRNLHRQTLLVEDIKKELDKLEDQNKSIQDSIQVAQDRQFQLNAHFDQKKLIWNLNQQFQEKSDQVAADRARAISNTNLLVNWKDILSQINTLSALTSTLESSVENAKTKLAVTSRNLEQATESTNAIARNFEGLTSTEDDIKNAISIIASKLSIELTECPLCLHSYPEGELQIRVAKALENISPVLKHTAELLEIERSKLKQKTDENNKATLALAEATRLKDQNNIAIEGLNIDLAQRFISKLYNATSLQEATKLHEEALKETSIQEKSLADLGDQLTKETIEPLEPILRQLKEVQEEIVALNDKVNEINRQITERKASLNAIELSTKDEEIENLLTKISTQEELIKQSKSALDIITKAQENLQRRLNQTNSILDSQEDTCSHLTLRTTNAITRWQAEGLADTPDHNIIQAHKKKVEDALSAILIQANEIASIAEELMKLKTYEEHFQVEREIVTVRGDKSEEEYAAILQERFVKAKQRVIDCQRKIATLNTLASNIGAQLENINERISSINPLWGKLLKRIVLDPRFADTKLVSYTHYRKQHADVNVTLHGEKYLVAQIASEAQITDLQFTFLLSMAQKYQWSPWRALLLDDPTQHHDLVHASAVFDLLRDYIMDQNFQILLATHDSTHANFFVRKLENDGIPTKLWKLNVTADGVDAVLS